MKYKTYYCLDKVVLINISEAEIKNRALALLRTTVEALGLWLIGLWLYTICHLQSDDTLMEELWALLRCRDILLVMVWIHFSHLEGSGTEKTYTFIMIVLLCETRGLGESLDEDKINVCYMLWPLQSPDLERFWSDIISLLPHYHNTDWNIIQMNRAHRYSTFPET